MEQESTGILLSTAYFPPIQYFTCLSEADNILIEAHENYSKQTYRNRCKIYSPNGIQVLSVPVERGSFHKVEISSLRIDYSRPWQKNHLRALKTAYNSSAFYEFYIDEISEIIIRDHRYLIDLNMEILEKLLSILELEISIIKTESYIGSTHYYTDLRDTIHPKKDDIKFIEKLDKYFQVFSVDNGFIPNLSILDLIFNMGPESATYLIDHKKKKDYKKL
jgi:hypothetical protein